MRVCCRVQRFGPVVWSCGRPSIEGPVPPLGAQVREASKVGVIDTVTVSGRRLVDEDLWERV
jgi:hypothetical protein